MNVVAAVAHHAGLRSVAKAQPMRVALVGIPRQRKAAYCGTRACVIAKVLQLKELLQRVTLLETNSL